jgi:2-polyprenyl-3-methyl-5-hydroxy-6-metoxy-1,4-benzoquinol methylase
MDVAAIRQGSRVLDVACGPGLLAGEAAARGATVVAVDLPRHAGPGAEAAPGGRVP